MNAGPGATEEEPAGLPTAADVRAAAARLAGHAHRTPVLHSSRLDAELGVEAHFKCENLQRMGAFKFRGAFNALYRLDAGRRRSGVVAYSSGNHAQAVALAGRLLDIPTTIVMPHDAPAGKVAATQGYGGRIVRYDRYTEHREEIARALAERDGGTLIPPFDHADVIAGQGTAALELFDQVGHLDALFVPLGGGGLTSGSALVAKARPAPCRVYGVEPAAGDDGQRSLRTGTRVRIETPQTIADGAQTQQLGELTFAIIRRDVDDIYTVPDQDLIDCMRLYAGTLKIVVEPTGCLSLAGLRQRAAELAGARVGVLVSGGNIDPDRYAELLARGRGAS
jgi:threonine dehydratase